MSLVSIRQCRQLRFAFVVAVAWASVGAAAPEPRIRSAGAAASDGQQLEQSRDWLKAIEHYEQALKEFPRDEDLEYGLRRSKIQFAVDQRYSDHSFQSALVNLSGDESMVLFDEVLEKVQTYFVDSVSETSFVSHGTESFYYALSNSRFLDRHMPIQPTERARAARREQIERTRDILRRFYWNREVANRDQARELVYKVANVSTSILGVPASSIVMEYIFGGCNALDDYSNCLTPDRLSDLYDNIDGEFVGLGIEMKGEKGKGMLLVQVLHGSPAAESGLRSGDYIVSINDLACRDMSTDEAANLLRGPSGSQVRVSLQRLSETNTVETTVMRREVKVQSVPVARILDAENGIAYLQMTGFQKTTPTELDEALALLDRQGMKALIWDVRGNPGGLLTAAVEVLDRFIEDGVLVSTRGRTHDQNWTYSAHRQGTWKVPLVLLIDGDSASASEIVAGAIDDYNRGTIVGRKTFGKWSVQSIFPIQGSSGLRLTTAKFYSPLGRTLGKVGVVPDVPVDRSNDHVTLYRGASHISAEHDPDIQQGLTILRRQLSGK